MIIYKGTFSNGETFWVYGKDFHEAMQQAIRVSLESTEHVRVSSLEEIV